MKINQIAWSAVFCICWTLLGCAKQNEQKTTNTTENTSETSKASATQDSPAKKTTKPASKDKPNLFLEFTITGGELDGQTFKAGLKYSASDQTTYEKGQPTSLEFSRAVVEGTKLEIDFECSWNGEITKGSRTMVQPGGKLVIRNVGKDPKYKFERLYINFKALTMELTEVGDWMPRASNKKLIYAGQGKVTAATAEAFTSRFAKRPASVSTVAFKYRARAIQY
ncbi:hypothetical protein BKI52_43980 [marine bacterium AO1-C]|nr:hypothetical protein BKI52_43980 [marine bacterium AO1-C]